MSHFFSRTQKGMDCDGKFWYYVNTSYDKIFYNLCSMGKMKNVYQLMHWLYERSINNIGFKYYNFIHISVVQILSLFFTYFSTLSVLCGYLLNFITIFTVYFHGSQLSILQTLEWLRCSMISLSSDNFLKICCI